MFAGLVEEVRGSSDDALDDRFRRLEGSLRAWQAEMAAVVGEVGRRKLHHTDGHRTVGGWMRAHALVSRTECVRRVRLARLLELAPEVGEQLGSGSLGVEQADELARAAANPRCGPQITEVLPVLLEHGTHVSFDDFRLLVRRWESLADTDGAHRDRDATHAARTASLAVVNGVLHLRAEGGALDGAAMIEIFQRFCTIEFKTDCNTARTNGGIMPRTDAQRRFDALHAIFTAAVSVPAGARPPEPIVNIVVDQVTFESHLALLRLIELRPDQPQLRIDQRRCETTSGIPLTPDDVVRAALAGKVRRVVLDSAGVVIDLGRKRRLFTHAAAEAIRLMSTHCGFAGCDINAALCEIDHLMNGPATAPPDPATPRPSAAPTTRPRTTATASDATNKAASTPTDPTAPRSADKRAGRTRHARWRHHRRAREAGERAEGDRDGGSCVGGRSHRHPGRAGAVLPRHRPGRR